MFEQLSEIVWDHWFGTTANLCIHTQRYEAVHEVTTKAAIRLKPSAKAIVAITECGIDCP